MDFMSDLISVILPSYNRAHLIERAIISVLLQSYNNIELIIVDDASSDNTVKIIKKFTYDPRVKYIIHDKNQGAAASRNSGIKIARGEYIAFLDSDDYWAPNKLEIQHNYIKNNQVKAVVNYYESINSGRIRVIKEKKDFFWQSLFGCEFAPGSTLLFAKECLQTVGLQNEQLKRYEDWEWQMRFAAHYKWHMIPMVLSYITTGHVDAKLIECEKSLQFIQKNVIIENKNYKKVINMIIEWELFYIYFKNRRYISSLTHCMKSFLLDPYNFLLHFTKKIVEHN